MNVDLKKIKKILIIKPRAIGDVILTTPFLRALKKAMPDSTIDYLLEPFVAPALYGNPNINKILVFNRHSAKNELPAVAKMRKNEMNQINSTVKMFKNNVDLYLHLFKTRYDLVFDLWGNSRTILICIFSMARYKVGFVYKLRKFFYNVKVVQDVVPKYNVYHYLDLLKPLLIQPDGERTEIYYSKQDEKYVLDFISNIRKDSSKIIGINPMGSWITKRWPEDKFIELIKIILREKPSSKIVLLWGPGEYEQTVKIKSFFQEEQKVVIAPETSVNQLAAIIKNLDVLITNDGAPKHIAVAVGTRTLTIYGPTNYKSWEPADNPAHLNI